MPDRFRHWFFSPIRLAVVVATLLAPSASWADLPDPLKSPMTATLVTDRPDCGETCQQWLFLEGQIDRSSPGHLAAVLARLGKRRIPVVINSPGGVVEAAMTMGRMIRDRKLDVVVGRTVLLPCRPDDRGCATRQRSGESLGVMLDSRAICVSACVLVLAGGVKRITGEQGLVGIHQMVIRRVFTPVINTFRVLRRTVGGKTFEISRTLIATRKLPTRVTKSAAPEALYSEVDRYLVSMGIGDEMMPYMHSTPPSSILWMTPQQLGVTRTTTDTIEPAAFVANSALKAGSPAISPPASEAPSCKIDVVGADTDLHGSVSITPWKADNVEAGLSIAAHLDGSSAGSAVTLGLPRFCDKAPCDAMGIPGALRSATGSDYRFEVYSSGLDDFLVSARRNRWLSLPILRDGKAEGDLRIAFAGGSGSAGWQATCEASSPPLARQLSACKKAAGTASQIERATTASRRTCPLL